MENDILEGVFPPPSGKKKRDSAELLDAGGSTGRTGDAEGLAGAIARLPLECWRRPDPSKTTKGKEIPIAWSGEPPHPRGKGEANSPSLRRREGPYCSAKMGLAKNHSRRLSPSLGKGGGSRGVSRKKDNRGKPLRGRSEEKH